MFKEKYDKLGEEYNKYYFHVCDLFDELLKYLYDNNINVSDRVIIRDECDNGWNIDSIDKDDDNYNIVVYNKYVDINEIMTKDNIGLDNMVRFIQECLLNKLVE